MLQHWTESYRYLSRQQSIIMVRGGSEIYILNTIYATSPHAKFIAMPIDLYKWNGARDQSLLLDQEADFRILHLVHAHNQT